MAKRTARKSTRNLDDFRQEIDRIDDSLHDLLIARAELTRAIAAVKRPGAAAGLAPAIRPAREAQILRRLLARHKDDLPRRVIVRIWREIMSASLQAQTKFHLNVYAGEDRAAFVALAHAHFGSLTPVRTQARAAAVVQECAEQPDSFGVVPLPEAKENSMPWWAQLAPAGKPGPRVFAKLPFVVPPGDPPLSAFAVGQVEQEPSGDDTTLLRIENAAELSRTRIAALLKDAGLEATMISAVLAEGETGQGAALLAVAGFVAPDDARLAAFRANAGAGVLQADPVGGFANPIVLADAGPP